jgi:hypothetical protein
MLRIKLESAGTGEEVTGLTLSDGLHTWSFPPGQDHGRIYSRIVGRNTDGIGVYAPTPFMTSDVLEEIERMILKPTLERLKENGSHIPISSSLTSDKLTTTNPARSKTSLRHPNTLAIQPQSPRIQHSLRPSRDIVYDSFDRRKKQT